MSQKEGKLRGLRMSTVLAACLQQKRTCVRMMDATNRIKREQETKRTCTGQITGNYRTTQNEKQKPCGGQRTNTEVDSPTRQATRKEDEKDDRVGGIQLQCYGETEQIRSIPRQTPTELKAEQRGTKNDTNLQEYQQASSTSKWAQTNKKRNDVQDSKV